MAGALTMNNYEQLRQGRFTNASSTGLIIIIVHIGAFAYVTSHPTHNSVLH